MATNRQPRSARGYTKLLLAAGLAAATTLVAVPGVAGAAWVGRPYYLDCAAGNDAADATAPATAWRTLAKMNTATLAPADRILLKSSTTCNGMLAPKGSGASGANGAVRIEPYGTGARPVIAAGGARAGIFLNNVHWYEIRNIEISNQVARDGVTRAGVYVRASDFGTATHFVVENVSVHDVVGCDCVGPNSDTSGGIVFAARGSVNPTGFHDIRVANNTVNNVDGYGIATTSNWDRRERHPSGTNPYVPITSLYFGSNTVTNVGGDGIVVQNGVNPLVERNKVDGFGLRATSYHVGMYSWNADGAVLQLNEVAHGASNPPAPAYGNDASNYNLTIQYNYSHDNGGGFLFFCSDEGDRSDMVTARYNLSRNDRNAHLGSFTTPLIGECLGNMTMDAMVYNNTVYGPGATSMVYMFGQSSVTLRNNILLGAIGTTINDPMGVYDHNVYTNITPPSGDTAAVLGDPRFVNPAAGDYLLRCGSPALGTGVAVPNNGGRDYYGTAIPGGAPHIGAYAGSCIGSP